MKQIGQERQKARLYWKQASYDGCVLSHTGNGTPYEKFGDACRLLQGNKSRILVSGKVFMT